MRTRLMAVVPALLLALAAPGMAQMSQSDALHGAGTPADIKAGTYVVETHHTQVAFSVSHFGISPFAGLFSGATGSLTLDPANPGATKLDVTIPIASVQTTSAKLDEELKSADWFDAGKFATATFHSTKVTRLGGDAVQVDGNLTLHGVTKPAMLRARLFGAATNPMSKKASFGFLGRMMIKRSDFGITKYVPVVSDETVLVLNAAFEAQ